ncbi:MAG: hypothetical protein GTO18_11515 [Anaerolineales bacterium]|nr:hypothetical protein [Anaerolineales bacterium]
MTEFNANCTEWPLCQGHLWPELFSDRIAMLHRYAVLIAGGVLVGFSRFIWRARRIKPETVIGASAVIGLLLAEFIMGGLRVGVHMDPGMIALHSGTSTVLWMALVATISMTIG